MPTPPCRSQRARALLRALIVLAMLQALPALAQSAADVRALLARGDAAAALAAAERLARANPRDPQGAFLQGVALMDLRRDDEALAIFTQLNQEYPELPDPLNNIALLHARGGRLEAAQQALETALRNDPRHRTARANLGQVHLMLAVRAWELAATQGAPDPALQRLLDGARALLGSAAAVAR